MELLHRNEDVHDLHSSPNIILMIKSSRIRWVGHVARMEEREMHTGFWNEYLQEINHLE
jgi:hypothetical protein